MKYNFVQEDNTFADKILTFFNTGEAELRISCEITQALKNIGQKDEKYWKKLGQPKIKLFLFLDKSSN